MWQLFERLLKRVAKYCFCRLNDIIINAHCYKKYSSVSELAIDKSFALYSNRTENKDNKFHLNEVPCPSFTWESGELSSSSTSLKLERYTDTPSWQEWVPDVLDVGEDKAAQERRWATPTSGKVCS